MRRVSCWFSLLMEDVDGSAECVCNSPVGRLRISATADGVYAVVWLKEGEKGELVGENQDPKDCARARQHLATCTDWLTAYFSGSLLESPVAKPPLVIPKKGTFFHSVWSALCRTEVGDTVSYSELAGLAGNPGAARAVGQAMRKHSIPLLIPCHRVVRRGGGGLGNYSGGEGTPTKQWLLEHEKKMAKHNTK